MTLMPQGGLALNPFVVIPLALVLGLAWAAGATWRHAGASPAKVRRVTLVTLALSAVWLSLTWMAAASGALSDFHRTPPPFGLLMLAVIAIAVAIAFSPFGTRLATHLPLWLLVGVQGFRLPLEVAMHRMYEQGVMPVQMSYSGRNFDIVTGITALLVAALVRSGLGGRQLVRFWNVLGVALLANIVIIAILSTPRIAYFGPDRVNVWVTFPPFVWLPAVMVLAALAGHLIIFRAVGRAGARS